MIAGGLPLFLGAFRLLIGQETPALRLPSSSAVGECGPGPVSEQCWMRLVVISRRTESLCDGCSRPSGVPGR